ncbi:MAG: glycoside hydrolase family 2 protein [Lachnospiraceae bacterium]|nr:glycoside hydrolase family 2 protein [Lachnospiraceae bacterium]
MKVLLLENNWKMHRSDEKEWIAATVPGSVYGDLLNAGRMENPFWKDNEDTAVKLMEYDYEYRTYFDCEEALLSSDEVILHFDGLDTIADITLNGVKLGHVENMHRTWEYSVKDLLKKEGNELTVYFYSPNKYIAEAYEKAPTRGTEDAMNGFVHIRKAHCMFGWDWGAHLPDAGIWRPVSLLGIDTARLDSVEVLQYHENGAVRLAVKPLVVAAPYCAASSKELTTGVTITAPNGTETVYQAEEISDIFIEHPELWWPNGYGKQSLYTVSVDLKKADGTVVDNWTRKIGLRTITMDRTPDKWGERFATCVNGVNIFAMGADYIPEDHLLGRVTKETTRALLEKAVFANFNSIRVWGGGYYPDDWFFDLCDEMGLVVWEDFMFACAVYDLTPEFEANITAEFIDNLKRIRHHASLGLMCGNNEMEQFVKERTWVSKDSEVRDYIIMYERILPQIMKQYAPQVYYWPASPSSGGSFDNPRDENRGDVHYWDVWHGNKPFSEYRKFFFRYLSEFGFQAFPSKKTVETFTDDERDMNIFSYVMEKHQRNGAANGKIMNYMQQTYKYPSDFETVIYASQLLQADAIRYGVEHFRRNRNDSRCMGAVYWQFNDCWPVASWSSVDYCRRLKALHYYARRFFAPIMISCEEEGMMNSGQELVRLPFGFPKSIRLCVANESMKDEQITVKWQVRDASAKILRAEETEIFVPALTSVWLEKVELPEIDIYNEYVSFRAEKEGTAVSEGTVIFSYPKYFRYENPELKATVEGNKITVSAAGYAKSVEILNDNEDLILTDNYFDLNGDSKTVEVLSGNIDHLRLRSVYDIG